VRTAGPIDPAPHAQPQPQTAEDAFHTLRPHATGTIAQPSRPKRRRASVDRRLVPRSARAVRWCRASTLMALPVGAVFEASWRRSGSPRGGLVAPRRAGSAPARTAHAAAGAPARATSSRAATTRPSTSSPSTQSVPTWTPASRSTRFPDAARCRAAATRPARRGRGRCRVTHRSDARQTATTGCVLVVNMATRRR